MSVSQRIALLTLWLSLSASAQTTAPTTAPSLKLFADSKLTTLPRICVEVVGHGPDLILIPGLSSSREVWRHTADRLKDKYTLHLVQVAGFAGEPARDNAAGPVVDPVVDQIIQYAHEQKLEPMVVIGHSLGGTMALRLAQQHPVDVKKILLADSVPFYGVLIGGPTATADSIKPMAVSIRDRMTAGLTPASVRVMVGSMVKGPTDLDRVVGWGVATDPSVAGRAVYDDMQLDMRPGMAAMTTPVTLVYPYESRPGRSQEAWDRVYHSAFEAAPHKTLVRIDDARHFVMYDQPQKFDAAVDAFLKN